MPKLRSRKALYVILSLTLLAGLALAIGFFFLTSSASAKYERLVADITLEEAQATGMRLCSII